MSYITVVGSANMDIGGVPFKRFLKGDSNPGKVGLSVGGVGGNIARNLSLMGAHVKFITALGGDIFADSIRRQFESDGIDLSESCVDPLSRSSVYLFITDCDGDMQAAVSDMEPSYVLTPEVLKPRLQTINAGAALVMDANLPEDSIVYLAENCTVPIFADTVSVAKAAKLAPALGRIFALKPNKIEAELLSGVKITDAEALRRAALALLDRGLENVYISLGAEGVYCSDRNSGALLPVLGIPPVNTTGAGDAFTAALVLGYLEGMGLTDCGRLGLAASAATAASEETVNPAMSRELLDKILKEIHYNYE